jgi:hypothetical protein
MARSKKLAPGVEEATQVSKNNRPITTIPYHTLTETQHESTLFQGNLIEV